jgi:hypothetical protein
MGGDLDLAQEALGSDGRGELRAEHLDGDRAVVFGIVAEVHRGHAAAAEFTLDRVMPGEGGVQGGHRVGHGMPRGSYLRPRSSAM